MNLIALLMKWLSAFVWHDADSAEVTRTKSEADEWYQRIQFDKRALDENKGVDLLLSKAKAWGETWYGKVVLSVLFMWLMRATTDYLAAPSEKPDEDDD